MQLEHALRGRTLSMIEKHEHSWGFGFSDGISINVECPWRIIIDGSVRVARDDDGQRFGLPEPVDAAVIARQLLGNKAVVALLAGVAAADLTAEFEGGSILQLVADSSGYEAWVLSGPDLCIVGHGGE